MDATSNRVAAVYENKSQRYLVNTRDYKKQYAHICYQRLTMLREVLRSKVKILFGDKVPVYQLFELTAETQCVLIGTLFKDMELKPNILKELGDEYGFVAQPVRDRYVSDNDRLILEDELQQVLLDGVIDASKLVTGAVVAVLGREEESKRGHFVVEQLIFPDTDIPSQVSLPSDDKYVMFLSGLEFAASNSDHVPYFSLVCDWLNGNCLSNIAGGINPSSVARVIITGNSLSQSVHERDYLSKAKYLTKKAAVPTVEPMSAFDVQLASLTGTINVDVMPGETDPSNLFWPQQPMIRAMLPTASRGGGLSMVTNPYSFVLDGVKFVITSGQNIADIMRYSSIDNPIEAMEMTLKLKLLAPTAPDTLACYPIIDSDPFILEETPHVYVCANVGNSMKCGWYYPEKNADDNRGVLMMALPSFSKTKSVCLLNLKNYKVTEINMS